MDKDKRAYLYYIYDTMHEEMPGNNWSAIDPDMKMIRDLLINAVKDYDTNSLFKRLCEKYEMMTFDQFKRDFRLLEIFSEGL